MALKEVAKQPCLTPFLSNHTGGLGIQTFLYQAIKVITLRKRLIIDCREFQSTASESQLVSALAAQTGYWPMFTFLMGNLIDLASVGLLGQKGASAYL